MTVLVSCSELTPRAFSPASQYEVKVLIDVTSNDPALNPCADLAPGGFEDVIVGPDHKLYMKRFRFHPMKAYTKLM